MLAGKKGAGIWLALHIDVYLTELDSKVSSFLMAASSSQLPFCFSDLLTAWGTWCKLSTHLTHLPSICSYLPMPWNAEHQGNMYKGPSRASVKKAEKSCIKVTWRRKSPSQGLDRMLKLDYLGRCTISVHYPRWNSTSSTLSSILASISRIPITREPR